MSAPLNRTLDQHTGDVRPNPNPDTAAYLAVMAWIDAEPTRALVGCTPSMVAAVAIDAYRKTSTDPNILAEARSELDDALTQLRRVTESNHGLAIFAGQYEAERSELREERDDLLREVGSLRDDAVRVQELEAENERLVGQIQTLTGHNVDLIGEAEHRTAEVCDEADAGEAL